MKNDGKRQIRKTDGPKKRGKSQKARVTRRRSREDNKEFAKGLAAKFFEEPDVEL